MKKIQFTIDGMVIKKNILWMGWPNAIIGYLAGLQEVISITFDAETHIFTLQGEDFSKDTLLKSLTEISLAEERQFTLDSYSESWLQI